MYQLFKVVKGDHTTRSLSMEIILRGTNLMLYSHFSVALPKFQNIQYTENHSVCS